MITDAWIRAAWEDAAAILKLPGLDNDGGPGDLALAVRSLIDEANDLADVCVALEQENAALKAERDRLRAFADHSVVVARQTFPTEDA